MIPFVDLTRNEKKFHSEWLEKVSYITKSTSFVDGVETYQLEKKLSELTNLKHSVTTGNGTDAIQIALRACGIGINDTVIIQNNTFWATCEAVFNVGAMPIIVDIENRHASFDLNLLEDALVKTKPSAVIIAHIYGWSSQSLLQIRKLCLDKDVFLIEDGAQSFGTNYLNESIFKNSFISTTSFYPTKVLGAAGNGGCIFTNYDDIAERLRKIRNHGRMDRYQHKYIGWNSRLDNLQAAYLNITLKYFKKRIKSRKEIQKKYIEGLNIKQLIAPNNYLDNGYCQVCKFEDNNHREKLVKVLEKYKIGYSVIYPVPINKQFALKGLNVRTFLNNKTNSLSKKILNLPLFPYMKNYEIEKILDVVNSFKK